MFTLRKGGIKGIRIIIKILLKSKMIRIFLADGSGKKRIKKLLEILMMEIRLRIGNLKLIIIIMEM
jgi:hypothetical protein